MSTQYNLGRVVGTDATINGYDAITLQTDSSLSMTNNGSVFTLSCPGLSNKQDAISGTPGQVVGFNNNGEPVAMNMSTACTLYGFEVDESESNPASKVRYLEQNASYTPFTMNKTTGVPNYGDWGNAWFIKNCRPCMLKYDGKVDYYLNPNDYTKKLDGTASDVTNTSYSGNAMVEIPTVWMKIQAVSATKWRCYFSNIQLDQDFTAWAHTSTSGVVRPYVYLPIYNGYYDNTRIRSISGVTPTRSQTADQEKTRCEANNASSSGWTMETYSQRMLINMLLLLIGKSTNTQDVFGNGNDYGYYDDPKSSDQDTNGVFKTGTMNDKGLFYGLGVHNVGVKVFGMEHWWGNVWHRILGCINDNGTWKIKMTRSTADGSGVSDYNLTGNGYTDISSYRSAVTASGSYIYTMIPIPGIGVVPGNVADGSDSTGYADALWTNNAQVDVALTGGCSDASVRVGAFAFTLNCAASYSVWAVGSAPSFLE